MPPGTMWILFGMSTILSSRSMPSRCPLPHRDTLAPLRTIMMAVRLITLRSFTNLSRLIALSCCCCFDTLIDILSGICLFECTIESVDIDVVDRFIANVRVEIGTAAATDDGVFGGPAPCSGS